MQHSFITSIVWTLYLTRGGGVQCSLMAGKANGSYCTEYNSHQKCTLGWFSPPTFVHSFICHFSTSRRSHGEGAISKAQ